MENRLQLRGISRSPSDRMSADGGCAESLNLQLEEDELRPIAVPESVDLSEYGIDSSSVEDIYHMHKSGAYISYITKRRGGIYHLVTAYTKTPTGHIGTDFFYLQDGEEVTDVKSIGNTVIVATNQNMFYALFKDGRYIPLGNSIPIPDIKFEMERIDWGVTNSPFNVVRESVDPSISAHDKLRKTVVLSHALSNDFTKLFGTEANGYRIKENGSSSADDYGEIMNIMAGAYELLDQYRDSFLNEGRVVYPILLRYAIRLYDDTRYAVSVPVLLGAEISNPVKVEGEVFDNRNRFFISINAPKPYGVALELVPPQQNIYEDWKDLVKAIEIYASPQISPFVSRDTASIEETSTDTFDITLDPYYSRLHQDLLLKNHQVTYLAKSFTVDEFAYACATMKYSLTGINFSGEYLMSQKALKESYQSVHEIRGRRLQDMNNRLTLKDITQTLYRNLPFLASPAWRANPSPTYSMGFLYTINHNGFEYKVKSTNSLWWSPDSRYVTLDHSPLAQITSDVSQITGHENDLYRDEAYAWVAYPDSRCTKITVYINENGQNYRKEYPTEVFSAIDVAYAWIGFGKSIHDDVVQSQNRTDTSLDSIPENRQIDIADEVFQSEAANPFVFPAVGRLTFGSEIIAIATAARAMSQGQFGQYPLYGFTKGGIWAVSINGDGTYGAKQLLSLDVAMDGSVTEIDQSVVFITAKGVKMVSGSDITELSTNMIGRHYELDERVRAMLQGDSVLYKILSDADNVGFMEFMADAKVAYDYTGSRLIFFSPSHTYQYIYRLNTSTWHKMSIDAVNGPGYSMFPKNALNTYPECNIVMRKHGNNSDSIEVMNFSTIISNQEEESVSSMYRVYLTGYNIAKLAFIHAYATEFGLSLREAKYIVESMPYMLLETDDETEADNLVLRIQGLDGIAEKVAPSQSLHAESRSTSLQILPGLVVTRPFDLENPDVRKVIKHIRARGEISRNDVKYILMGSFDGREWMVVKSLRGGSFKMFRLVLVCRLSPAERLSWIDIDFDIRFNNRPR